MPDSRPEAAAPFLLSAVIATYNVAAYLSELLASMDAQTCGIENVELIFVNDGSTDDSGRILDDWALGREHHVTILHQENQGVAAARNNGMACVRSEWVTFTDSDDMLTPTYFEEVAKFAQLHGSRKVALLAAHLMTLDDHGDVHDKHVLGKRFRKGSRVVDMHVEPLFQLAVNHAVFRSDLIREHDVRFDDRIRPIFEDAHFIAKYLLLSRTHHLGLMASAKYLYRTRTDGGNLLHSGYDKPERYTNVLRYGELDLLRTAASMGPVPRWLENVVLYDLAWAFRNERSEGSASSAAPPEVFDEFHSLMSEIMAFVSRSAVRDFETVWLDGATKRTLMWSYDGAPVRPQHVVVNRIDENHQQIELSYWFSGDLPEEQWIVDNRLVQPVHATVQDFVFYGRTTIRKRIVWLTRGVDTRLLVDGRTVPATRADVLPLHEHITPELLRGHIMAQRKGQADKIAPQASTLSRLRGHLARVYHQTVAPDAIARGLDSASIHSRKHREAFKDAWVFMDRDTDANDNGEHLYRWVRAHHPEINAWFVLSKTSSDWQRLSAEGFRLVEYRSKAHKALMLNAIHVASSHLDDYVQDPFRTRNYGPPKFSFTFLQHGVTNYDLSRWFNRKRVDLLATVTTQEYEAIAGPGPYKFSSKDTALCGFPRHDALLAGRRRPEDRDLVVVMPTWRKKIMSLVKSPSGEMVLNDRFAGSDYVAQLQALLRSPALRAEVEGAGKRLAFMPHPLMRPYLDQFEIPEHVTLLDASADGIQSVMQRSAAFITDYSSVAFDVAAIGGAVVYFQFDGAEFFRGGHTGRRGYFDYGRDGFGPVVETVDQLCAEVSAVSASGWEQPAAYAERAAAAFVTADGRSCERTFEAMRGIKGAPDPRKLALAAQLEPVDA